MTHSDPWAGWVAATSKAEELLVENAALRRQLATMKERAEKTEAVVELFSDEEGLARRFHCTYESLAANYGYETRAESRVPWDEVPVNNRKLMVATARSIIMTITREAAESAREGKEKKDNG